MRTKSVTIRRDAIIHLVVTCFQASHYDFIILIWMVAVAAVEAQGLRVQVSI